MDNRINELIEQIGGRERLEFLSKAENLPELQKLAQFALSVLDAQGEPVAFYANGVYYNTERAALKDGAQSVMPLYTTPPAASVPDGWKLVPIEPTEDMIISGFESEPDEDFSKPEVWEAFKEMSGCQQAAHKARLCYAAMLEAAPEPGDLHG